MKLPVIFTAVIFILLAPFANAQFQGDVFFDKPSVSAHQGETAIMSISGFSGAIPVGAVHLEISFDPRQLEAIDVIAGDNNEFANNLVKKIDNGVASIITANDSSLTDPFGTVNLAKIQFRVVGSPNSILPVSISVKSLLDTSSQELSRSRGFGGEIVVLPSIDTKLLTLSSFSSLSSDNDEKSINGSDALIVSPNSELGRRASKLLPMGELVVLETENGPINVYVDASLP